jgi:hypothetical protein
VGCAAAVIALWTGPSLRAQSVEDQLREMRQAIQDLQQQVKTLREQLADAPVTVAQSARTPARAGDTASKPPDPPPSRAAASGAVGATPQVLPLSAESQEGVPPQVAAEEKIPLLESEVADLAQTKVESNSRFPVKIFGTLVTEASFNSAPVNWLDNPSYALPARAGEPSASSFSMNLRQSRLGALINGPTLGGWKTTGLVVADFFAGSTTFVPDSIIPVPRLLYGYVQLEHGNTKIEAGQDQMILAPQNPTSIAALAFPELYEAGNLYARGPQVRVEQRIAAGRNGEFVLTGGVMDLDASDSNVIAEITPPNPLSEPPHRPSAQGRLAWRWQAGDAEHFEIGVSGDRGAERFPSGTQPSWGGALDLNAQVRRLGFTGEWYAGRNLAALGGAIGQFGKSTGGFAELRVKANERLSFNSGYGSDHLFDLRTYPAPWARNSGFFGNFIYQFTPELAGSIEFRRLSLYTAARATHYDNNLDFVLAYSF